MLSSNEIIQNLNTKFIGKNILIFEEINSTNTYLKNLNTKNLPEGTVVFAESQSQGRGRYERRWYSEAGKNLTFSILLTPNKLKFKLSLLPILTSSAIALAINNLLPLEIQCKWPNDLLLDQKKFCGILIESILAESYNKIIVGIGINVNQKYFNEEISQKATSLYLETGIEQDRIAILKNVLQQFERMYLELLNNSYSFYLEEWKKRSIVFGKIIRLKENGNFVEGIVVRLDDDGGLILNINNKEVKIFSGEIII